jgi:hypothetical protein
MQEEGSGECVRAAAAAAAAAAADCQHFLSLCAVLPLCPLLCPVSCVLCRVSCVVCLVLCVVWCLPWHAHLRLNPLKLFHFSSTITLSFLLRHSWFLFLLTTRTPDRALVINPVCRVPVAQWVVWQCAVSRNAILP